MNDSLLRDLINSLLEDKKAERKYKIITRVVFITIFLGIIFLPFFLTNTNNYTQKHTALINIEGVVTPTGINTSETIKLVQQAMDNQMCENIILKINSPGGSATQSKIIFDEINELKSSSKKKIYSVIDDVGASGGYYIAASGNMIFANSSSIVGSIGVRLDSFNVESLAKKLGIESRTISSGGDKLILDPFQSLTSEHKEHLQSLVTGIHKEFIDDIKIARGSVLQTDKVFTGLFWTGVQAKELGLIDEVGSIYDVNRKYLNNSTLIVYNKKPNFLQELTRSIVSDWSESSIGFTY